MSFRRTCVRLLLALSTVLCAGTANAAEPPWLEVHSHALHGDYRRRRKERPRGRPPLRADALGLRTLIGEGAPQPVRPADDPRPQERQVLLPGRAAAGGPAHRRPGILSPRRRSGLHRSQSLRKRTLARRGARLRRTCCSITTTRRPRDGSTKGSRNISAPFASTISRWKLAAIPNWLRLSTKIWLGTSASASAKSLTELLGAQVWLSLPDLFTMKHDTSTRNQGTHHTLYYAESWIVMHYLLHEKKLPETGVYFDLVLNQHVPVEDAIQKAYGMSSGAARTSGEGLFSLADSAAHRAGRRAADQSQRGFSCEGCNAGNGQMYRFPAPVGPDDKRHHQPASARG